METLKDLDKWIEALNRFGSNIEVTFDSRSSDYFQHLRFRLYTDTNKYAFEAITGERSYLGCIASCRKPRAGEDWTRGRDLSDGNMSHETWVKILSDIVSYELVKVHYPEKSPAVVSENTGPDLK